MSGSDDQAPPQYKIGNPYQIQGTWYYPAEDYKYEETGIASWYGAQFHGRNTANGEIYDMNTLTAAHRTLPMPSFVRVTNLENGRSLILKVNDRGPFARNRIIDISRRGAQLLGFHDAGTARVRVQIMADKSRAIAARTKSEIQLAENGTPITVARLPKAPVATESLTLPPGAKTSPGTVNPPQQPPVNTVALTPQRLPAIAPSDSSLNTGLVTVEPVTKTNIYIQAGAFGQFDNANKVRARLSPLGKVKITSVLVNGRDLYRVRVGPLTNVADADQLLGRVIGSGYLNARIIVD
ncbi:MAG: septal ring lytic transglycosylase RlpA family protein [Proteobacteria bacterium]|nr:septal ring lytic transglycosylase RlpA family protein [Pseudomonadota bacterium]